MNSGIRNKARSSTRRPVGGFASAAAVFLLLGAGPAGFAISGAPAAQRYAQARPAPPPPPPASRPAPAQPRQDLSARPTPEVRAIPNAPVGRPYAAGSARPGQEHLPEWLAHHQNLTPAEQENLLRHEPGFNRLPPEQQQRVINRLRSLDSRPPAERQRMLARNEAFERLSPEGKQDVRAAAQALTQLPVDRRRMVRQAFNDLRQIPPAQRQAILNSARFSHDYSPQERHMLNSLLSVEPYQR